MADFPISGNLSLATPYKDGATYRLEVSPGNPANTKSAWQQISAATGHQTDLLIIKVFAGNFTYVDQLFDVGIGTAGSEIVIAENLYFCRTAAGGRSIGQNYVLPVSIPAGSRISVRSQATNTAARIYLEGYCLGGSNFQTFQTGSVATYGAVTADSGGTGVDPGGTVDTKGGYSQLTAATTQTLKGFFFLIGQQQNTARSSYYFHLDIAIGAAGSERIILPDWCLLADVNTNIVAPVDSPIFPISVPVGSRIAARASCSGNDATDRLFDLFLYGIY